MYMGNHFAHVRVLPAISFYNLLAVDQVDAVPGPSRAEFKVIGAQINL